MNGQHIVNSALLTKDGRISTYESCFKFYANLSKGLFGGVEISKSSPFPPFLFSFSPSLLLFSVSHPLYLSSLPGLYHTPESPGDNLQSSLNFSLIPLVSASPKS